MRAPLILVVVLLVVSGCTTPAPHPSSNGSVAPSPSAAASPSPTQPPLTVEPATLKAAVVKALGALGTVSSSRASPTYTTHNLSLLYPCDVPGASGNPITQNVNVTDYAYVVNATVTGKGGSGSTAGLAEATVNAYYFWQPANAATSMSGVQAQPCSGGQVAMTDELVALQVLHTKATTPIGPDQGVTITAYISADSLKTVSINVFAYATVYVAHQNVLYEIKVKSTVPGNGSKVHVPETYARQKATSLAQELVKG